METASSLVYNAAEHQTPSLFYSLALFSFTLTYFALLIPPPPSIREEQRRLRDLENQLYKLDMSLEGLQKEVAMSKVRDWRRN